MNKDKSGFSEIYSSTRKTPGSVTERSYKDFSTELKPDVEKYIPGKPYKVKIRAKIIHEKN